MTATNNGGRLERVPGFDSTRVMSQNMGRIKIARPYRKKFFALATNLEYDVPQLGTLGDDRARVTTTSEVPWRSICQLLIEGMHPNFLLGTGWFAGPNTIVTAAHNIISPSSNARAQRIHVFPGRDADIAPFGQHVSSNFAVHARWAEARDINYDFGVIRLQEPVGQRAGWFGMSALNDAKLQNMILNNAGYPSDQRVGSLWFDSGRVIGTQPNMILYDLETQSGQSGSPVFFRDEKDDRYCVAIHAYGGVDANRGVRITREVISLIQQWSA